MTLVHNIVLLIVGTTATLAAFGGETWRKGPEPLLKRINSRGWVSLGCLLLALVIGTAKEVRTAIHDGQQEKSAAADKENLEKKLEESKRQLQLADAEL